MARSYKRDANGRFAGGGGGSGGGGKRPAAKPVSRGKNRLTRDNAGKITSVGGNGATARGGRLKTASGNQRATQTARAIGGSRAGTIKGKVTRNPAAGAKLAAAGKGKATKKVDTSIGAIAERRKRALRRRTSIYLNDKLNNRSAVVRSAANAIYNRQRRSVQNLFGGKNAPSAILRDPIGIMPGLSGSKRDRATQNLESARTRVRGGRRR